MRRGLVVLLVLEAAAFGIGVLWVLFAGSLLQADIDRVALPVAAGLCVLHVAAAIGPRGLLWPTTVVQLPIIAWAATRGEALFYCLAGVAALVLVTGSRSLAGGRAP